MTVHGDIAHFDLLIRREFLDAATCARIVAQMRAGESGAATIYGTMPSSGAIDANVRSALRHAPAPETLAHVWQRLAGFQQDAGRHFDVALSQCEEPQFLRYRVGDFFVAHQDGNTGLLRLDSEARRVSVVVFLCNQADAPEADAYCGGSLVFHDWRADRRLDLAGKAGTLVAFRAETTHEVIPVTHGERCSIAGWYR
jgi:SM-20-related protein